MSATEEQDKKDSVEDKVEIEDGDDTDDEMPVRASSSVVPGR